MFRRNFIFFILLSTIHRLLAAQGPLQGTLQVSASVASECTVKHAILDFGTLRSGSSASANTNVLVRCSNVSGQAYISLDLGQNESGGKRFMIDGKGNRLRYSLYRDPSHAMAWDKSGGRIVPSRELADGQNFTVFGTIEAGQNVLEGHYQDTIKILIELQ